MLKSEYDTVLRKFGDLRWVWARWARLEHGIWARSTEYGFVISGPGLFYTANLHMLLTIAALFVNGSARSLALCRRCFAVASEQCRRPFVLSRNHCNNVDINYDITETTVVPITTCWSRSTQCWTVCYHAYIVIETRFSTRGIWFGFKCLINMETWILLHLLIFQNYCSYIWKKKYELRYWPMVRY